MRYDPRHLRFDHWAMPVRRRRWAAAATVLHRFQRMTVCLKGPHRVLRSAECRAFDRAVHA